ncbi:dienelactone hydrolase family protein [Verrucomicrobiota bacterium]
MSTNRTVGLIVTAFCGLMLLGGFFAPPLCVGQESVTQGPHAGVEELRDRTEELFREISDSRTRIRHEGMMLYLIERIGNVRGSNGKSRAKARDLLADWQGIYDALKAGKDVLAAKRGRFEWAYKSGADGSGQPMMLWVPDVYNGKSAMPLIVVLHGLGGNHRFNPLKGRGPAHIEVSVNGRGSPFYRGLGELDVLEATAFMKGQYNVDPDRVYIFGYSMGGWGVFRMTSRYPDIYAAAVDIAGWATGLDLGNLSHIPVQIHHGDTDWSVHVGFARLAAQKLKKSSKLVHFCEYPNAGHGIMSSAKKHDPLTFLLNTKKQVMTRRIQYTTTQVTRGRCQWLEIERLADPHYPGTVSITAEDDTVRGYSKNVSALRLHKLKTLFPARRQVKIILDNEEIPLSSLPEDVQLVEEHSENKPEAEKQAPVYQRGGFFNIYDGQPIRIVAPHDTQEGPNEKALIVRCSTSADMRIRMPYGHIPVVDADEFDAKQFKGHLVVIGSPEHNKIVSELLPHLPVRIEARELVIDGMGSYPLDSTAMSFVFYSPYAPECRMVWLLNATVDTFPCLPFLTRWEHMSYSPDIVLHDVSEGRSIVVAAANFGDSWKIRAQEHTEPLLPKSIEHVNDLSRATAAVYMKDLGADFALYENENASWWGWDKPVGGGKLTLSSLKALIPSGMQPIVRARLTRSQLENLLLEKGLRKDKRFQVLSEVSEPPEKAHYDLVFCEPLMWRLRASRFKFPKGNPVHTGKDIHDYLDALTKPESASTIHNAAPVNIEQFTKDKKHPAQSVGSQP